MKKILCLSLIILSACQILPQKKSENKLQGDRSYIIKSSLEENLNEDLSLKDISLSEALMSDKYVITGSNQNYLYENIQLKNNYILKNIKLDKYFDNYFAPHIIIVENRIYVKTGSYLNAYSKDNNKLLWSKNISATESHKIAIGGGMMYDNGNIYLTAGHREIIAINSNNGKEIWRYRLSNISRSTPIAYDNKLFVMTIDNKLYALDSIDGTTIWRHEGAGEYLGLFASPSVSVANQIVLVPHSSGQLHALNIFNGEEIWSVDLSYSKSSLEGLVFNDINFTPIVKNDIIYVSGNMGLIYAIDLYNGQPIWRQEVKTAGQFWINNQFLYVINENDELIALDVANGKYKWSTKLSNNNNKKSKILYGPVMVNDQLLIASDQGELIFVSPYEGKIIDIKKIGKSFVSSPIIVNDDIYINVNNSTLAIVK